MMNKYLLLIILLLIITLLYTFKYDKGMFLFILLIISVFLYIENMIETKIDLIEDNIKNTMYKIKKYL